MFVCFKFTIFLVISGKNTIFKHPMSKGGEYRDEGYTILRLSNKGRRWWLMWCLELKELIAINIWDSNVANNKRLGNIRNLKLLLLFSFLCMTFNIYIVIIVAITPMNSMVLDTRSLVSSTTIMAVRGESRGNSENEYLIVNLTKIIRCG